MYNIVSYTYCYDDYRTIRTFELFMCIISAKQTFFPTKLLASTYMYLYVTRHKMAFLFLMN